mgnify:CR=1 FL=1|tara:strand:- start:103 stop:327 length:225 start_codon:yes stop_codon:yes gene_type:complete
MKEKIFPIFFGLFLLSGLALPTSAFAEENERNDPEHSITEAHEGVEAAELIAVGAGLVIAIGLAFVIGRRSGKK